MVKFSIIIVNYNVKYFLEQCLCSVKRAIDQWSLLSGEWKSEVFVADNNSADNSISYLEPRFPFVTFISNNENLGFARANNKAMQMADGQYILFLNPDTILPEDFFVRCVAYLDVHPGIGAMGVQMIDGAGNFLPESKRGFPGKWSSFCKLSGLTALFPHSKLFANYYLGHLDRNHNHQVGALSGACMLIKKEALDKCGGFDERFFMYAEDIDLSYRIQQSGYATHYVADVTIIHFKGESTTKDIRYLKLFYKAMVQFVQKHYRGMAGSLYVWFLKLAIGLRALFAAGRLHLDRKKQKQEADNSEVYLEGDECSIEEVRASLKSNYSMRFVQTPTDESKILLCQGDQFSFRTLIERMRSSPGQRYNIHSLGSSSIVGSNNSRNAGEVIILPEQKK